MTLRTLGRLAMVAGAIVVVGLLWTGYKALGRTTDGMWPGTNTPLPIESDDRTMPPILDIVGRLGEPLRLGDDLPLWRALLDAGLFTFREAFTGFAIGLVVGMAMALLMLRFLPLERGLLPWIIVSQTIPLIALAPIVVAWGNQIDLGTFQWEQWMSVSMIAAHLTFRPGTATFAGADGEHGLVQVDITAAQCQRLADPQPGADDQPEQGGIAMWPQASGRRQTGGYGQQIADLGLGVDVWWCAMAGRTQ